MIDKKTWKKGWELLDKREKRNAWVVLTIIILAALSSALMVGSVMPFLSVLADPKKIHSISALNQSYEMGGFTSEYTFLVALGLVSLTVILVSNLLQILRAWTVSRFALMRSYSLSYRLLSTYLKQPYEYFLNHHSGEMSTQILSESQEVVNRFFRPASDVIASILTVIAIVIVLLWVDPVVALLAFGVLGGLYGGTFMLSRKLIRRSGEVRAHANRECFRIANEAIGGVKDIKLLGREATYVSRFCSPAYRMARANIAVQVLAQVPQYVMQAVGFGSVIILCLVLIDPTKFTNGAALGDLLPLLGVFAFAGQRLLPELSRIYNGLTQLNAGTASVDIVHRDLMQKTGADLPSKLPAPIGLKKELQLEHVDYTYPSADHAGLHDISLSIRAGEKIGIVGTTGAGKTTLADVILGLLIPLSGFMKVDGVKITDDNMRAWQQTVGYVPQDIFLTDASLAENIALGLAPDEINPERLIHAAKIAQIHNFVQDDLPEKYETLIGERGVRLSGGQRQRIGIARALYHDADLIVFDEATSALDNLTEIEVMGAIEALPGDKTIILIAHRLSTVRSCEKLLVLSEGRIAETGTWDELMSQNTHLKKIVTATMEMN